MRYWLTLLVTGAVIFGLTFILGLSIIGVDVIGPGKSDYTQKETGEEETTAVTGDGARTNSKQEDENAPSEADDKASAEPDTNEDNQSDKTQPAADDDNTEKTDDSDTAAETNNVKPIKEISFDFTLRDAGFVTIEVLDEQNTIVALPIEGKPYEKGAYTTDWLAAIKGKALPGERYRYVIRSKNQGVPVLLYHEISSGAESNLYTESVADFRKQMEYLDQAGYEAITLSQLTNYMQSGTSIPEKAVLIAFNDGYKSTYTRALPILQELGFNATVFVLGSFIDEGSSTALNWQDLKKMADSGRINIASSSYSLTSDKSLLKQQQETEAAYRERLRKDFEKINTKIKEVTGSVPDTLFWAGSETPSALSAARAVGYENFLRSTGSNGQNYFSNPTTNIKWNLVPSSISLTAYKTLVENKVISEQIKDTHFNL